MENQNNHKLSTFWFGFLLGGFLTGSTAFFLGTKQGRKTLKHILELSENIEETLSFIADEFGDEIKEKGQEIAEELKKNSKNHHSESEPKTLNGLLDKIKTLSPIAQKQVQRFFVKDGKFIDKK